MDTNIDTNMDSRQETNHTSKIMLVLAIALFAIAIFWGTTKERETRTYQTLLENEYQQSFYQLLANVEDISVSASKVDMTTSPAQTSQLLSDIWWQANMAEDNLAALPLSYEAFDKLETLLNHTGDYCRAMSKQAMSGTPLTEEQQQNIITLGKNIAAVSDELHQIEAQVNSGELRFVSAHNDLRMGKNNVDNPEKNNKTAATVAAQQGENQEENQAESTASNFNDLKTDSIEYPTLIYDGPFSDHMVNKKPEGLTGEPISMAQAKEIAMKFPGLDPQKEYEITEAESGNEATIPVYCFDITSGEEENAHQLHIDISKTGGHNIMFMDYARPETTNLTTDEGIAKAHAFLEKLGYKNMQETYTINQNNVLTIAFAYKENDILLYPDQIKVQVAMDDGRIIALEAAQYFMNHKERNLETPAVSVDSAREKVPTKLQVTEEQLTVIPLDGDKEYLTWEYKGIYNNEDYVVYIDATTGEERNVVKIISTPGGSWAM